jgi:uncharacterized protein YecT (DUF1311 family)
MKGRIVNIFAGLPVFGAILFFATISAAQDIDCTNPQDQSSMTQCAYQAWEAADKELNATWKIIVAEARDADEHMKTWGDDGRPGHEETLRTAQRAWITFRDAQCDFEGYEARGGTMEPMIVGFCLERLTAERTKQLTDAWGMER